MVEAQMMHVDEAILGIARATRLSVEREAHAVVVRGVWVAVGVASDGSAVEVERRRLVHLGNGGIWVRPDLS
eukprot:1433425-Pyramimonas_sp.AAC.1